MFDTITSPRASLAKRRGSSMAVSVFLHGAVIGLAAVATYVKTLIPAKEEPVTVQFRAPPPPPPPPPPPAGHKPKTPRQTPKTVQPRQTPRQIIQPKEIPQIEEKPPEDVPEETEESVEGGVEGGVVGGVVGGVLGGQVGGQLGQEGPPMLLGQGMSRPVPIGDCAPGGQRSKPPTPEQARQMGITGTVLVEYVVHTDGRVGEIALKNPTAAPILFMAVKAWLESCTFSPSMQGLRPIPVKIIQPFIFTQR